MVFFHGLNDDLMGNTGTAHGFADDAKNRSSGRPRRFCLCCLSGSWVAWDAAGAFALLLLWIYYSSQIFLIGAEFTRAWADIIHQGGPIRPTCGPTISPPFRKIPEQKPQAGMWKSSRR